MGLLLLAHLRVTRVALFAESGIDFSGWEFEVATKSSHSALVAELYKGAIGQEFWWATARRLSHRMYVRQPHVGWVHACVCTPAGL